MGEVDPRRQRRLITGGNCGAANGYGEASALSAGEITTPPLSTSQKVSLATNF